MNARMINGDRRGKISTSTLTIMATILILSGYVILPIGESFRTFVTVYGGWRREPFSTDNLSYCAYLHLCRVAYQRLDKNSEAIKCILTK